MTGLKNIVVLMALWSVCLIIQGCAGDYVALDSDAHDKIIADDRAMIAKDYERINGGVIRLSLDEAIDRAKTFNLDARVSALEVLSQKDNIRLEDIKALPSVNLSRAYFGRSNEGASSSRSVISGTQSLEPSISTEPHHKTIELSTNWNVIDAALAILQGDNAQDSAIIAGERHKKVLQNIVRDVRSAYWLAYAEQQSRAQTAHLLKDIRAQKNKVKTAHEKRLISAAERAQQEATLNDLESALLDFQRETMLASLELKSLTSLPPDSEVELMAAPDSVNQVMISDLMKKGAGDLEELALRNRPEMRETVAQRNVSLRDTRMEIIRTLPGAQFFAAYNHDDNKFLSESSWVSYSATIVQSLTSLLTLPARYNSAKNREKLERARRVSLAAALITQVHLARQRLAYMRDIYTQSLEAKAANDMLAFAAKKRKHTGFASGLETLPILVEAHIANVESTLAYANLQDAVAAMFNTLGIESVEKQVVADAR